MSSEGFSGDAPKSTTLKDHQVADSVKTEVYVYEPLVLEIIVDLKPGDDIIKVFSRNKIEYWTKWIVTNKTAHLR